MVGDIFQPTHLLFVLVVALLVLGPKRLPEVGRTLGAGIRDFRQALSGDSHDRSDRSYADEPSELVHQDDASAGYDTEWQPESVDPPSFDEPVEMAPAEPTTASATTTLSSPPSDTVDGPHEVGATSESTHETPSGSTPAAGIGATPEEDLAFSEHELAHQTAESSGSSESGSESPINSRD